MQSENSESPKRRSHEIVNPNELWNNSKVGASKKSVTRYKTKKSPIKNAEIKSNAFRNGFAPPKIKYGSNLTKTFDRMRVKQN